MITFSDDELEVYFRKQAEAEEYLNQLVRQKRIEQLSDEEYIREWETQND